MNFSKDPIQFKTVTLLTMLFLGFLKSTSATFKFGSCYSPPVVQNFTAEAFFNKTWYASRSYGNQWFQGFITCSGLASRITPQGEILMKGYYFKPILGNYVTFDATSRTQFIINNLGLFPINFDVLGGLIHGEFQASIVDTDYDTFAVIYLCNQHFFLKTEKAFVLTRERNDPNADSTRINAALQILGIPLSSYQRNVNSNCGSDEPEV